MEKSESLANLIQFVVDSVQTAHADDAPFHHLQFDRIFPDDFYAQMVEAMPVAEDYRAMSGKSKMGSSRPDGKPTRAKIDLFPEYIRHLPPKKRAVWDATGRVLRSKELQSAFVQRLAPGLKGRFGENFAKVNMYPVPILTRDIPGIPYLQAYRQSLERDHRSILSAGGQFHAAHRHDLPRGVA